MSSEHDKAVLNCIFNPLLPVSELAYDKELPHDLQGWLSAREFNHMGTHRHIHSAGYRFQFVVIPRTRSLKYQNTRTQV